MKELISLQMLDDLSMSSFAAGNVKSDESFLGEAKFSKAALLVSFTFFEDWSWEEIAQKILNVGSERVNRHSNKGTVHSQVL